MPPLSADAFALGIIAGAVLGLLLIAVGLLGAMVRAHQPEDGD